VCSSDLPGLKKLLVVADVQTGKNAFGAAGGGVYFYFNDNIDVLTGPVYFFDGASQPDGKNWMWTVQLDVDIPFKVAPPTAAPAASPFAAPPVAPTQPNPPPVEPAAPVPAPPAAP
jgi:hypothetical protein